MTTDTSPPNLSRKARIWGVMVFLLPIPSFFVISVLTHSLSEEALARILANPLIWLSIAAVFAVIQVLMRQGFRPFYAWHQAGTAPDIEALQLALIGFPKKVLVLGLAFSVAIAGLVIGIDGSLQNQWIDLLIIGYSTAMFTAMPCYIVFLQSFEHWNRTIPFSNRHFSMSLLVRVSLVFSFILTAILGVLLVAAKNIVAEAVQGQSTWNQVLEVGLPAALVGMVGGVTNIVLMMSGIVGRLQRSKEFAANLAEGDVSMPVLELTSRDELGVLANQLNLVHENLNGLLGSTKQSVRKTVSVKDQLIHISGSTVQEISRIGQQVPVVDGQAQETASAVDRAVGRVHTFHEGLAVLNEELNRQSEMVQDTSSALEQMTSSIENISRISTARMESSQGLEGQTVGGQSQMKQTLDHLHQIAASVEDIRSITGVIQSIAAQTNLLAMNAAIEAAHAGEAGAGFAVVADEIRKLAQTSSKNSKEITTKVKSIIQAIGTTVEAGNRTAQTFDQIHAEMDAFLQFFREIENTMSEMRIGSTSILTASEGLKERSTEVREKAQLMRVEADGLSQDMNLLKEKAQTTRKAMTEVSSSVTAVDQASKMLRDHTQLLDQSTQEVSAHVDRFKTRVLVQ